VRECVCVRERREKEKVRYTMERMREKGREGNAKFDPAKTFQIFPIR